MTEMTDDGSPLSLEGIKTAAAAGRLPDLARRLVLERRWSSLDVLLTNAVTATVALEDAAPALSAICEELAALPPADQREALAELREVELHAASALARRADRPPFTVVDRAGLGAAAALYLAASETKRAAVLFEKAGDDERAAELWGGLGDLDRMEACLARVDERRTANRRVREARQQFDTLMAAGERLAAVELCHAAADPSDDGRQLGLLARRTSDRLCRGRSVAFRLGDGRVLRLCEVPAVLGRDPDVELPLREPTVSRRHARLLAGDEALRLEDAGSRGGTRLSGLPLAGPIPLRDSGEIGLGASCRVRFDARPDGSLELRGETGLDRGFWAVVGPAPLDLAPWLGLPAPLHLDFLSGVARVRRSATLSLRAGGTLVGAGCDLLHGETLEVVGVASWEVM
jgi:hypothetical protein